MAPFKEFLSTLKSSITALHSALVEVNVSQLSDELLELNLVELDNEVKQSLFLLSTAYATGSNQYKKG